MAMSGHEKHGRGERIWLTPPELIDHLGPFDLDPCACPEPRPWPTATRMISPPDDGLAVEWQGRVWCNPPYDHHAWDWLARLADHDQGIALIFARTETAGFHRQVWQRASAVLFLKGRIHFYSQNGERAPANGGAPSALIAYGNADRHALKACAIDGHLVDLAMSKAA